jgi:hypothetical protein
METKSLENIVKGDTILIDAKQVRGGKVSLQFAEVITNPNRSQGAKPNNPLVSILNKSDSRFAPRARRAWITGEKSDITNAFGLDLTALNNEGDIITLNLLNPKVENVRARVVITETVVANDYQRANIETSAKRAGKDGDFILCDGKYIFSNSDVVPTNSSTEDMHTFLEADERAVNVGITAEASSEELSDYDDLAEAALDALTA